MLSWVFFTGRTAHMHRRFLSKPIKVCSSSDRYLPLCPGNTSTELKPLALCVARGKRKKTPHKRSQAIIIYIRSAHSGQSLIVGFLSS